MATFNNQNASIFQFPAAVLAMCSENSIPTLSPEAVVLCLQGDYNYNLLAIRNAMTSDRKNIFGNGYLK